MFTGDQENRKSAGKARNGMFEAHEVRSRVVCSPNEQSALIERLPALEGLDVDGLV